MDGPVGVVVSASERIGYDTRTLSDFMVDETPPPDFSDGEVLPSDFSDAASEIDYLWLFG